MATPTTSRTTLAVSGMTCAHCEIVVERVLRSQPGVHAVRARYGRGLATLSVDESFRLQDADAALRNEGYSGRIADPAEAPSLARRAVEVWPHLPSSLPQYCSRAASFTCLPESASVRT